MALIEIAPGHLGAVVTYLEMTGRPSPGPPPPSSFRLEHLPNPKPDRYRSLFEKIGGPWLWYSRLLLDDADLARTIGELHVVLDQDGADIGMIELDFSRGGECLIRFLGLIEAQAGKGNGRWLFARMLALAWRKGVVRVHVHTCTLDHPAALRAYLRAGFRAYKRAFESFPDPRSSGILQPTLAPAIPILSG